MTTKDYEFTIGKGHTVVDEKSNYPDVIRLVIPKDRAVALAEEILRAHRLARQDEELLLEIPLFGQLEEFDDE